MNKTNPNVEIQLLLMQYCFIKRTLELSFSFKNHPVTSSESAGRLASAGWENFPQKTPLSRSITQHGWKTKKRERHRKKKKRVGGWTNPLEKILVKMGSSSPNRGENKKIFWNHHPEKVGHLFVYYNSSICWRGMEIIRKYYMEKIMWKI